MPKSSSRHNQSFSYYHYINMKIQILLAVVTVCMAQMKEDDENFITTLTLKNINKFFSTNPSVALKCYNLIKGQYEEAIRSFSENMMQCANDLDIHFQGDEHGLDEAKYGVLKLNLIGESIIALQETLQEYLDEDNYKDAAELLTSIQETVNDHFNDYIPQREYLKQKPFNKEFPTFDDFIVASRNQTQRYMKIVEDYFKNCMKVKSIEK